MQNPIVDTAVLAAECAAYDAASCADAAGDAADGSLTSYTANIVGMRRTARQKRARERMQNERPQYILDVMRRRKKCRDARAQQQVLQNKIVEEMVQARVTHDGEDVMHMRASPVSSDRVLQLIEEFEERQREDQQRVFSTEEHERRARTVAREDGILARVCEEFIREFSMTEYREHIRRYIRHVSKLRRCKDESGERHREWFMLRLMMHYNHAIGAVTTIEGELALFNEYWHTQRMKDFHARIRLLQRLYKRTLDRKGRIHFACTE